jgi:hypothetical protein
MNCVQMENDMNILNILRNGIQDMVGVYVAPREYEKPAHSGFAIDNQNLRGDVLTTGNDIRKAITEHGESYQYSRYQ